MTISLLKAYNRLSPQQFENATTAGFLISAAAIILYAFFGHFISLPQSLAQIIRDPSSSQTRRSLIIISGVVFLSALIRTLYHQHIIAEFPFDSETFLINISTIKLIVSGILVGSGYQLVLQNNKNGGLLGIPRFTLTSFIQYLVIIGTAILTSTYKIQEYLPTTPRVFSLINKTLPNNIPFDSLLLISMLVPFIGFILSEKKSLKGLIQCLLHFGVGILTGAFFIVLGISNSQFSMKNLKYTQKWMPQLLIVVVISLISFGLIYLFIKYLFTKPLFSNKLSDISPKISFRILAGFVLIGLGFGISGIIFETFLLILASGQMRILVFWGLPCFFSIRSTQVFLGTLDIKKQ